MLHASGARRHASLTAVLSLAFAASALFSVVLTRDENSVAALWLANGILAAALLMPVSYTHLTLPTIYSV